MESSIEKTASITVEEDASRDNLLTILEGCHHRCLHLEDKVIFWCGSVICRTQIPTISEIDMERRNQESLNHGKELVKAGHRCLSIVGSYPCQIKWCQRVVCKSK